MVELAAAIGRALPHDARPDVRAWALRRVLLAELDSMLAVITLDAKEDARAAAGVIQIAMAVSWPTHASVKAQLEELLGEYAH